MITQQDFNELFKDFVGSYNRKPTLFLEMAWYEHLRSKSEREIIIFFKDIIQRYKFLPSIAEVLEQERAIANEKAWDKLHLASSGYCPGIIGTQTQVNKLTKALPEVAQAFLNEFGLTIEVIGNSPSNYYRDKFNIFAKNYKPKNINQKQLGESK